MTIEEAFRLFNITNINNEDEQSLKKKYRKLMIKYHPDNSSDENNMASVINEEYKKLVSLIKKIELLRIIENKQDEDTVIIDLNNLINILDNKEIILNNGKKCDKTYLSKNTSYIIIYVELEINDTAVVFDKIVRYNSMGNYEMDIDIPVEDIDKQLKLTAKKYNDKISINIDRGMYKIPIRPHKNLKIELNIKKVIIKEK